jgi:hypothetical protein
MRIGVALGMNAKSPELFIECDCATTVAAIKGLVLTNLPGVFLAGSETYQVTRRDAGRWQWLGIAQPRQSLMAPLGGRIRSEWSALQAASLSLVTI